MAVEENTHQTWARALIAHLQTIKKAVVAAIAAGYTALKPEELTVFAATYDGLVRQRLEENPQQVAGGPRNGVGEANENAWNL